MPLTKDQIFYGDVQVRNDAQGFISLNDMWVAAGCPEGKHDPRRWKDKAGLEFIKFIAEKLNVPSGDIYKTTRGKFGGTWAHWQIALAYAKYLSPEFHAWANQAIKDRVEESYNSINTKINRGSFAFQLFLQCTEAIGAKEIRLH